MRFRWRGGVAWTFAVAVFFVVVLASSAADATTMSQASAKLRSWHLKPPPLVPAPLPAELSHADVTAERYAGIDYDLQTYVGQCRGENDADICIDLRRFGAGTLQEILDDPVNTSERQIMVGNRMMYALETGHASAPSILAWQEQDNTYMAVQRYVGIDDALVHLIPFVKSLKQLQPAKPADPCVAAWPTGGSKKRSRGRTTYDFRASQRMVCQGFGTKTGGLHIDWLSWGMQCAVVAQAIGARYGEAAEFSASGACSAAEVSRHRSAVSVIGAACSTAADLLGLKLKVVGEISGLACEAAPEVGEGLGTALEAHHEYRVARAVTRKKRCLEFQQYLGVSRWHAVRCS